MRFFPPPRGQRTTESLSDNVVAAGGLGGYTFDPIDGDVGFVRAGSTGREIPIWSLEKARAYSVVAYRTNPMARAIIDTYVSFAVGDSGVTLQVSDPAVREVALRFWNDPKVMLGDRQPDMCRDHLIMGESILEMMVGPVSGATRFSPIDPMRVGNVHLIAGNALWPSSLDIRTSDGTSQSLDVVQVDDLTGLRMGQAQFWASFKALLTDRRGTPFLSPILDDLDDYDTVLSNLIDRTALMRYIGLDVTLKGDNVDAKFIANWIRERSGNHVPRSGTMEVHNESVEIKPINSMTGSVEDTETAKAVLTNIAGGAGLAKTWLADPQDSNRATSLTMAEPVRRRVGQVQNIWIGYQTELVRYVVDQAVAAGRIPATVTITTEGGAKVDVPAAQTVRVIGPEIAAQNAEVNALVLFNLGQALQLMTESGVMTAKAAQFAAKKAWEGFVGIPYQPELDSDDPSATDDTAELIESTPGAGLKLA